MGNEKFLHLMADKIGFLARVDPRLKARAGQDVDLVLDRDRAHLFSASTSKALDPIDIPGGLAEAPGPRVVGPPTTPDASDVTRA